MKKLFMYMIIIFSIMIIPTKVNAGVFLDPSYYYFGAAGGGNFGNTGSVITEGGSQWNYAISPQQKPYIKVAVEMDLSNIQEEFITFILKSDNTQGQGVVDLDGDVCESVPTSTDYDKTVRNPYGFICRNSKKTQAYLNWNLGIASTASSYNMNFYMLREHGVYNDRYIAAINTQTEIQQQQNQIINNTDTSSQSSDFTNTINDFVIPNTAGIQDLVLQTKQFMAGLEASGRCNSQRIPIPFTDYYFRIPCMTSEIYSVYFPEILAIYQLVIRGIGYYYILVNLLKLFKESIDPFNYRIEVLDL